MDARAHEGDLGAGTVATDAALIARSLDDPRAFMPLLERHQRVLFGYLARRIGPDIAEDIVAETFARAFEQRNRFDDSWDDARPWLFGIALNLMRTHLRSESRRSRAYRRSGAALLDELPDEQDIAERLDAGEHGPALTAAISQLSVGDRDVLLLFAWGDLGYDDIAATLDIPVGTVRSRLNRARRQLATLLDDDVRTTPTTTSIPSPRHTEGDA